MFNRVDPPWVSRLAWEEKKVTVTASGMNLQAFPPCRDKSLLGVILTKHQVIHTVAGLEDLDAQQLRLKTNES